MALPTLERVHVWLRRALLGVLQWVHADRILRGRLHVVRRIARHVRRIVQRFVRRVRRVVPRAVLGMVGGALVGYPRRLA